MFPTASTNGAGPETWKVGLPSSGAAAWVPPQLWGPVHETLGAYEQFHSWSPELLRKFGKGIISRIPSGSIYFGGTDAGRFRLAYNLARPTWSFPENQVDSVTRGNRVEGS